MRTVNLVRLGLALLQLLELGTELLLCRTCVNTFSAVRRWPRKFRGKTVGQLGCEANSVPFSAFFGGAIVAVCCLVGVTRREIAECRRSKGFQPWERCRVLNGF